MCYCGGDEFAANRNFATMEGMEDLVRSEKQFCHNRNHGRSNVPVRFCPDCGQIVNPNIVMKQCLETLHSQNRRWGHNYCIDCGGKLRDKLI